MAVLITPATALRESFVEALGEYHAEGLPFYARVDEGLLRDPAGFAAYVRSVVLDALPGGWRPTFAVAQTLILQRAIRSARRRRELSAKDAS